MRPKSQKVAAGRRRRNPARPGARAREQARLSPLPAPAPGKPGEPGPLPDSATVHPDAGHDPGKTREEPEIRSLKGKTTHKGDKALVQAGKRRHAGRTSSRHSNHNGLQRCCERDQQVINAYFGLAGTIITLRRLIREARTLCRWDTRPVKRP